MNADGGGALHAFADSSAGRLRTRNEDRFHCDPSRGVFIVVDGVGGHAAGDRAAELALAAIRARLERETAAIPDRLREAISGANDAIRDASRGRAELAGMSCVVTAAVVHDSRVYAGHVGDTRLYKLRRGGIAKLTRDHSPVGVLEDGGVLGELQAMHHPQRNEIWRDVGTAVHCPGDPGFVDVVEDTFEPDAALVLCSDGLSDQVSSRHIASTVYGRAGTPALAVSDLIGAANDAGGRDNVTVIVVEGSQFGGRADRPRSPAASYRRHAASAARLVISFALGAASAMVMLTVRGESGAAAVLSAPAAAAPRTFRVGASAAADFSTINAALAAAQAGDTVVIEEGTYRESLGMREGVSIESLHRRTVEVRRPVDLTGPWTAVSAIDLTSGSLRGVRIVGTEDDPIDVGVSIHDAAVSIEDVEVVGVSQPAIRITGAATPRIHGCELHDNLGPGLRIEDAAAPEVTHTAVVANGVIRLRPRHGIEVAGAAAPVLRWNVVRANGSAGILGLPGDALAAAARENALEPDAIPHGGDKDQRPARGTAVRR